MRSPTGTLLAAIGGGLIGWSKKEAGFEARVLPNGTTEQHLAFQPIEHWWLLVALGLTLILLGYFLSGRHATRVTKQS